MDRKYWDEYYKTDRQDYEPSLFARFVEPELSSGCYMADLGCGNGRDSFFFAEHGHKVASVDRSGQAIALIERRQCKTISAFCDNFVSFLEKYDAAFDALYSRFSIHAVKREEQEKLIGNACKSLKENGLFFIEARSVLDELYGKGVRVDRDTYFYNGHTRRFIRTEELEECLMREHFEIVFSRENRGFAPFGSEDPVVLRVIARKRG